MDTEHLKTLLQHSFQQGNGLFTYHILPFLVILRPLPNPCSSLHCLQDMLNPEPVVNSNINMQCPMLKTNTFCTVQLCLDYQTSVCVLLVAFTPHVYLSQLPNYFHIFFLWQTLWLWPWVTDAVAQAWLAHPTISAIATAASSRMCQWLTLSEQCK